MNGTLIINDTTTQIECSNCGFRAVKDNDESIPATNICIMCLSVDSFREVTVVEATCVVMPEVSKITATINFTAE